MSDDRWKLVKGIFLRAAERPAAAWPGYLDAACAGDADLRAEVASLLVEHDPEAVAMLDPARGAETKARAEELPPDEAAPRDEATPGTFFDEVYYVERRLGLEPGGTTFIARHALAGDRVVLKVFDATVGIDAATSEARVPRLLRHSTLASVFDIRTTRSGRFYLVREWFDGEAVGQLLARGDLGVPRVLEILRRVAEVFDEAERQGIEGPCVGLEDIFLLPGRVVRLRRLACSSWGESRPDSLPSTFVPEGVRSLASEVPERESRRGAACLAELAAAMLDENAALESLRGEVDEGSLTPLGFVDRLARALGLPNEGRVASDSAADHTLDLYSRPGASSGELDET